MELPAPLLSGIIAGATAVGGAIAWLLRQPGSILREQREVIDRERAERRAAEQVAKECRERLQVAEREVAKLRRRQEDFRQAADVLVSDDVESRRFWNGFHDGIAVTSQRDGGTIIFVNLYLCRLLGYSRDEMLSMDWTAVIHPQDLRRAQRAEAGAHDHAVVGFVARYKRHDSAGGGWRRLRWDCKRYDEDGLSVCRITDEGLVFDPLRVLVAEDDPQLRMALQADLEVGGMTVVATAATGEHAVAQALALRPDVVLMDLSMPGIGGAEAARRIASSWPEASIVVLTGSTEAEPLPGVATLTKPVDRETLLAALARATRKGQENQ